VICYHFLLLSYLLHLRILHKECCKEESIKKIQSHGALPDRDSESAHLLSIIS